MHFAEKMPNVTLGQACTNPSHVFCMGSGIGYKQSGDWGLGKSNVAIAETPIKIRNKRKYWQIQIQKKQIRPDHPAGPEKTITCPIFGEARKSTKSPKHRATACRKRLN